MFTDKIEKLARLAAAVTGLILLALTGQAAATPVCSGTAQTISIAMPATINLPRDSADATGTLLTPWFSSPEVTNFYTCNAQNSGDGTGMGFRPYGLTYSGLTISSDGIDVRVYNTNVAGVGVAVKVRVYANGCGWLGPYSLEANGSVLPPWTGNTCNQVGTAVINGGQVSVALVRTGPITSGGSTAAKTYVEGALKITNPPSVGTGMRISYNLTSTNIITRTCSVTTRDLVVSMPKVKASSFGGVGSTSAEVPFSIYFTCERDIALHGYMTFIDANDPSNRSTVLPLSADSTATGLGIQIIDYAPVSFGEDSATPGTPGQFSALDSPAIGPGIIRNKRLEFSARYIQTGPQVTPGTANGKALFTMSYQ